MNYIKLTTNLPNPTNIYHVATSRFVRFVRFVFEKKHSRMNYIKLTTNLPNPTNIYRVATYKIRVIRAISVRKKILAYVKMNTNLPLTNHLICRQNQKKSSLVL